MSLNVCRLCLGNDDLIWVFDKRMEYDICQIIETTTGIQIRKTDSISQLVCAKCCRFATITYEFKLTSNRNDRMLKARQTRYNISQISDPPKPTEKPSTCKSDEEQKPDNTSMADYRKVLMKSKNIKKRTCETITKQTTGTTSAALVSLLKKNEKEETAPEMAGTADVEKPAVPNNLPSLGLISQTLTDGHYMSVPQQPVLNVSQNVYANNNGVILLPKVPNAAVSPLVGVNYVRQESAMITQYGWGM